MFFSFDSLQSVHLLQILNDVISEINPQVSFTFLQDVFFLFFGEDSETQGSNKCLALCKMQSEFYFASK